MSCQNLKLKCQFDFLRPGKLQEVLARIGRSDLSHVVKEYKESSAFKKVTTEKRRMAINSIDFEEGLIVVVATEEERRWRDMFAMAVTQSEQLVEQMVLLRKAIQQHNIDQSRTRIEDTLDSIETAQNEMKHLTSSLQKAISTAGLEDGLL